ncbi:MAG TPA: amidohydrolase family protein [Chitinophagaceae bacterium]|nr:amidohydrolase family protein [Chitinophagaceae bacterium]
MKKPEFILLYLGAILASVASYTQQVNDLKLKDYRPVSIYKNPQTDIQKAKYPAIDVHSHDNINTDVDKLIGLMNEMGIEKKIILSYATGTRFDSIVEKYARYKDRFDIWCGFDYTGFDKPGWEKHALEELERCHKKGAKGVGELGDKGLGEFYSHPVAAWGLHIDDPKMKVLFEKCAELKMPVNVHVAEDEWMYWPADSTNDGLMNAAKWKIDLTKKGILDHDQLINTLENAVKNNPKTIFIACHLANCCTDLNKLARLFDKYPNLYADIAARFGEFSPVPRYTRAFMEKYQDRILYGVDVDGSNLKMEKEMYKTTFRILETADEHFYRHDLFDYHWPLYGLSLSDKTLKKIYRENARMLMKH